MKPIYLILLITLTLVLAKDYQVPDLDYSNDKPTCDNVNSLIAANNADIARLTNYVEVTLPARISKLKDITASVKKTCQITQSKTPSLLQVSKLRMGNVKALEKLSNQVKSIAKSVDFGKESSRMFRSLVQLNMNTQAPDLCTEILESITNLRDYLNFLIPAITDSYVLGKVDDRRKALRSFNEDCLAAACDNKDKDKDADDEDKKKRERGEEEEAAYRHHLEEEEAWHRYEEEEAAWRRHHEEEEAAWRYEEEEAAYHHWEEEEAAWHRYEEEEAAWHRHYEEEEAIWHHYEEEEAAWHRYEEEEIAWHRHHEEEEAWHRFEEEEAAWHRHEEEEIALHRHYEEEEAAWHHYEEEEAAYHHWEEEEAAWHHYEEEEEAAAEAKAEKDAIGSDATYTYYPTLDSRGGDITQLQGYTVRGLKKWCTANVDCLGFNTKGFVKSKVTTIDAFVQVANDASVGFYLKKSAGIDNYNFYPYQDSDGNDILQLKGYSIEGLKTYCSSRSDCAGFNIDGWIKKTIKSQNNWKKDTSVDNFGLYVKDNTARKTYNYDVITNKDSNGNDIVHLYPGYTIDDLKKACDLNPDCKGFNSEGYLKNSIKSSSQLSTATNPTSASLYVKGSLKTDVSYELPKYTYYPRLDSSGNDIQQLKGKNIDDLKAYCDSNSDCKGFNTHGYMKKVIKPFNQWSGNTDSDNFGFYLKGGLSTLTNDYTFNPNKDSSGNDIKQFNGGLSVDELKAICDANPDCKGFNLEGYLKTTIKDKSKWETHTEHPNYGLYVKNT